MAAGGRRQGTPGKSYTNRTDLQQNYDQSQNTAGTGGMTTGGGGGAAPMPFAGPFPEDIPKLDDPTARPDEPLTTGLDVGPGGDSSVMGLQPVDMNMMRVRAAYMSNPTPELRRVLEIMAVRHGV